MTLSGRRIALTRPRGRGDGWADALRELGAGVEHYPLLEIEELDGPVPPEAGASDGLVFISPTAVDLAWPRLRRSGLPRPEQRLAAVGEGTAAAIARHGAAPVLRPDGPGGAEALLGCLLPVAGRRWLIVQGEGGRGLLERALREAGAEAAVWTLYRRRFRADQGERLLHDLERLDAIVASSSEALRDLHALAAGAGAAQALQSRLVVVMHPRIAATAESMGFRNIRTAADAASVPALLGECLHRRR